MHCHWSDFRKQPGLAKHKHSSIDGNGDIDVDGNLNENAIVSENPDGFIITTITTLKNKVQKDLFSADKYSRIEDNNCQIIVNFLKELPQMKNGSLH